MGDITGRGRVSTRVRGRRRAAVAVVAGAAVVAAIAAPSGAQDQTFRNGEAEATAQTFSANIVQGNANIGFTYGLSIANYRDTTGTAEARALDLGVFPTLFGVEQCDGSAPILNPATFPPKTRVDSGQADSANSRLASAYQPGMGSHGPGPLAGEQDATATKLPSSNAITRSQPADMFLLAVIGGKTESTAKLENGVREAHAVSTAEQLRVFGGLFTFYNVRWEATALSGGRTAASGGFLFERATVLGSPRTNEQVLADFAGFKKGLEDLLKPLGVTIKMPELVVDGGRARVTPMEFAVKDMPWGSKVIAPFLGDVQSLKEAMTKQLLEKDCKNESAIMLMDVFLNVLAGSGSIVIQAGGVEVFTADTDFSALEMDPLPVDSMLAAPIDAPVEVMPLEEIPFEEIPMDEIPLEDIPLETVDAPIETTEVAAVTSKKAATEETATATTGLVPSRYEDTDAGTAAAVVGLLGLLGAIGLSLGERLRSRRMSRRIP